MSGLYTGSMEDIHAIDVYLEGVMEWINELKDKYSIVDREAELPQNCDIYITGVGHV